MPPLFPRPVMLLVGTMLVVLSIMVVAGTSGVWVADALRSYASGGTRYAVSHMGAVAELRQFAATGDDRNWRRFVERLHVARSDAVAREILEEPDLPLANSYPFLIGGENHPDDAAALAWSFRLLGWTDLMAPAVDAWREADEWIYRLEAVGDRLLQSKIRGDSGAVAALASEIDRIDRALLIQEDRFAQSLGKAARVVSHWLTLGLVFLGVALAALIASLGWSVARRLRRAQEQVAEREQRFIDIVDTAADWVWETDNEMRYTFISDRFVEVVGVDRAMFIGRKRRNFARDIGDETWRRHLADLEARRPFRNFEYIFDHQDGRPRYFRVSGKPVLDARGRFVGYRGTGSDVTEEIEARREVREKRRLLEATLDHISQGVSVFGPGLKGLAFNRRFYDLLGFPSDQFIVGDPFEKFIRYNAERGEYGDGDVDEIVAERVRQALQFAPHKFERKRPNGTVIEIEGRPLPEGGIVTTYTDVTERHRSAERLVVARTEAEAANAAKTMFLANMSHELRTPLNGVIGFASILADEKFGALSERYVGYARDIKACGEHLLAIINDILDLSKVETGAAEPKPEHVDFRDAVDDCLKLLSAQAMRAEVTLANDVAPDNDIVWADPRYLRQVLINVIGNAVKFSEPGGCVVVTLEQGPQRSQFRVTDQGIGIPKGEIKRVFEPFAQVGSGYDKTHDGTGLGLALVRRLVELHDGEVTLDSEPGRGTTVSVSLPAAPLAACESRSLIG